MSTKFPSISAEIRQPPKKLDLALKPREEIPDEAVETQVRAIGEKWGASTQMLPSPNITPKPSTAPLVSVRFDAPNYLDKALSVMAAEQGVTKTYLILKALQNDGFQVNDVDLVKDRRRWKK